MRLARRYIIDNIDLSGRLGGGREVRSTPGDSRGAPDEVRRLDIEGRRNLNQDSALLRDLVASLGEIAGGVKYDDIGLRSRLAGSADGRVSPDIIPYGQATVPNPKEFFTSNWDSDVGVRISAGAPNYIYLRAMNYGPRPAAGQGYLYFCDATLTAWPSLWTGHALWTQEQKDQVDLVADPDRVAVGERPFVWTPPSANPPTPCCLVSRIVTPAHPNPVPQDGTLRDLIGYFGATAEASASAVRAVAEVEPDEADDFSVTVGLETRAEAIPHLCVLVDCREIPIGCVLTLAADAPGLKPPMQIRVTTSPRFVAGVMTSGEAKSSTPITLGFRANGWKPPQGAWVSLQAIIPAGNLPPRRGVRVGSFTLVFR